VPHRVLVIDDSPLILEMVRMTLEQEGLIVACASDLAAFEAERLARSPDLILVDVQMPEIFGDDLAATLRGAYGVTVPILLFSSLDDAELERRVQAAGLLGFVSKKAGMTALVARVRQVLAMSQA